MAYPYHMRDFNTGIATAARFDSSVTHKTAATGFQGNLVYKNPVFRVAE